MKPVYQTTFDDRGNCLSACFASILECPLEAVDFCCFDYPDSWCARACELLKPLGVAMVDFHMPGKLWYPPDAYYIASGNTTRHPERLHSVVYRNNALVHDPHPHGHGITTLAYLTFLVRL